MPKQLERSSRGGERKARRQLDSINNVLSGAQHKTKPSEAERMAARIKRFAKPTEPAKVPKVMPEKQAPPPHPPSPSSKIDNSSTVKRPMAEPDEPVERPSKKLQLGKVSRNSINGTPKLAERKVAVAVATRKQPKLNQPKRMALEEPNPEIKLKFFPYGDDSVPLMFGSLIKHEDLGELVNQPDVFLRQNALAFLRKGCFTSADLGREDVSRTGPARIIDDCDLYYRKEKIYVASERGLLLTADYLKLIGVPETQHIRFHGHRPGWAKRVEAKQQKRECIKDFNPTEEQNQQGFIPVEAGFNVMVLERVLAVDEDCELLDLAYGTRCGDSLTGLFPYDHTSSIKHDLDSVKIDWNTIQNGCWAEEVLSTVPVSPRKNIFMPVQNIAKTTSSTMKNTCAVEKTATENETTAVENTQTTEDILVVKETITLENASTSENKPAVEETVALESTRTDNLSHCSSSIKSSEVKWEDEDQVDYDED